MRRAYLALLALVLLIAAAGCDTAPTKTIPAAPPAPGAGVAGANVQLTGSAFKITGPYAHENLAVYLFHSGTQDPRDFITLDQGLKDGVVQVTEKAQEQVSELQIQNKSTKFLFIQEGDRLKGGKQDRTVFSSLVVPPQSGTMPIPSFCIEHSRWQAQATGNAFTNAMSAGYAPKEVRAAAKMQKSQSLVWAKVAEKKEEAAQSLAAPNTNSSLNEAYDSPQLKAASGPYTKALDGALKDQPDAVGVAIAVNGQIEEVDVYPNYKLLTQTYPRLLQSYAVQAATQKKAGPPATAPAPGTVAKFITEGREKGKRDESINADNKLAIKEYDNQKAEAATTYNGKVVHWQAMSKTQAATNEETEQARPENINRAQLRSVE